MKNIAFSLSLFIALALLASSAIAGCCVTNDYTLAYYSVKEDCISEGNFYFDTTCLDPTVAAYAEKGCCILDISGAKECYFGSQMLCNAKFTERGTSQDSKAFYGGPSYDFGSIGENCTKDKLGTCADAITEIKNCTEIYFPENPTSWGCIDPLNSIFFCGSDGSIKSDCSLCLGGNCGGLACSLSTGSCEDISLNNCSSMGYQCCGTCEGTERQPAYNYNKDSEYKTCNENVPYCCKECKIGSYCCSNETQCNPEYRIGACPDGRFGCSVPCNIPNCAENEKINSPLNPEECNCEGEARTKSTDSGSCCLSGGNDVYFKGICSAIGQYSISGFVKDSAGTAIAGAVVVLNGENRASGATPADGSYNIPAIKAGNYNLITYTPGYYPQYKSVSVSADALVNFTLEKRGSLECNSGTVITGFNLSIESQGNKNVKIVWDKKCQNVVSAIYLRRKAQGTTLWERVGVIDPMFDFFIDKITEWGKSYDYEISFSSDFSDKASGSISTGDILCEGISPGQEFCLEEKDSAFYKNTASSKLRKTCNEMNIVVDNVYLSDEMEGFETKDCAEYQAGGYPERNCILTSEVAQKPTLSKCKEIDTCEMKGLPFGLFYTYSSCTALPDSCYYDFSKTTVDSCLDCRADLRCSDFRSRDACRNNKCAIQCNWSYTNLELNKGVCYSSAPGNCSICNEPFMNCDASSCMKLGECMFLGSQCGECDSSFTCYNYTTQQECEGNPSEDTIRICTGSVWTDLPNSNSACNKRCAWKDNSCVKDGDFNSADDCQGLATIAHDECVKDNTAPITEMYSALIVKRGDEIKLNANEPLKKFFYCIDQGNICCPEIEIEIPSNPATSEVLLHPFEDDATQDIFNNNGIYYLRLYSIDKNSNREEIRSFSFYAKPNKLLDPTLTSTFERADKYNLTVFVDSNLAANCTFILNPDESAKAVENTFGTFGTQFKVKFANLDESGYLFTLNCKNAEDDYSSARWLSMAGEGKFNVTIITPYHYASAPKIGRGNWRLILNFSEKVNITAISYIVSNPSTSTLYTGQVSTSGSPLSAKNFDFIIVVPVNTAQIPKIEDYMNSKLKISAVLANDYAIEFSENDADMPYFTIDTKPPEPRIIVTK